MPSEAEFATLNARLDEIAGALRLMIATQQTHTELLGKIFEAACPSEEGGQIEEAMRRIVRALREQTEVLERVEAELGGLGAEVEAGVMRGLAQALGVEGSAGENSDGTGDNGTGGREGEGSERGMDGAAMPGLAPPC